MADVHEPEVRSYNMSRIKSKDTKPELIVRKYLHGNGFRYKLYDRNLPGKPDIVLPKFKTVIFVNGCFWHGHEYCKDAKRPENNSEFWASKIIRNKQRDSENIDKLLKLGWNVLTIWECQLQSYNIESTLSDVVKKIVE